MYHKGEKCIYNDILYKDIICQEGWCSGCIIHLDYLKNIIDQIIIEIKSIKDLI